jgi:predicted dithiol-disulfide oxidoreductase (DUF899 family)
MPEHEVDTREGWLTARKQLLEREEELTRLNEPVTSGHASASH